MREICYLSPTDSTSLAEWLSPGWYRMFHAHFELCRIQLIILFLACLTHEYDFLEFEKIRPVLSLLSSQLQQ